MIKNDVKVGSIRVDDPHPIPHFVGKIRLPSGHVILTSLPRRSRDAARRDARKEIDVLLDDKDLPLHLL